MAGMAVASSFGLAFTTDDLDAMPIDGNRYELIDGQMHVSPSPSWSHQSVVFELAKALDRVAPRPLRVVIAPFDVRPDRHNDVVPDVLVAAYDALAPGGRPGKRLTGAPLLVVEVLSPSSRLTDPTLKKAFYARLGVRSYWIVDPDPELPSLSAFELAGSDYREITTVTGDESFEAHEPFPVTLRPTELVRGLFP
jgi:Uma2 family endonuclease